MSKYTPVVDDKRKVSGPINGRKGGGLGQDTRPFPDALKIAIAQARNRGGEGLVEIIERQVQIALLGYDTVTDPKTRRVRHEEVDSATRQMARKFIADRCGLAVKVEQELSGEVATLPLTLIVMGEEDAKL